MSAAQHTPGRLRVSSGWLITADDHIPIAEESAHHTRIENDANMRRLAACWNACQGVPIEVLEATMAGGLQWSVPDQIEKMLERDELLAALQDLMLDMQNRVRDDETMARCRAAIARTTGSAA